MTYFRFRYLNHPNKNRVSFRAQASRALTLCCVLLAPVVQTLDSAIHRINHYPADKYYRNQLRYPLDSDLSGGQRYPTFEQPGPEVERNCN